MNRLRQLAKMLPTLGLSFALAIAVWISAVTEQDPSANQIFPSPIAVDVLNQDPGLMIIDDPTLSVTVQINAPESIWARLLNEDNLLTASVDLSGLGPGEHLVPVQVEPGVRPAEVTRVTPRNLTITLEKLASRTLPIQLVKLGEPSIGFQAEDAVLDLSEVTVTGPESLVQKVSAVRATIDLNDAHESINANLQLSAVAEDETTVRGVAITPERVQVEQPITQRGGFRSDLVIRPVYQGRLANGYRLTSISVFPPAVTVFSADPQRVNDLPGFVETLPINLDNLRDDLEVRVALNLPEGISLVGEQRVLVQVGVAAIESSQTLANQIIEVENLTPGLAALISPEFVDIILSGPLPLLDALLPGEVRVVIDATGLEPGSHQVVPQVILRNDQLRVESILPGTLEVEIIPAPTPTPTRRP